MRLCERYQPHARDVRGRGLLRGLAVTGDATPVINACRERGVLLSVAGGTVVRFAPPLTVSAAHIDEGLRTLGDALGQVYQAGGGS